MYSLQGTRKSLFLLGFIITIFLTKGLFLSLLFPIFQQPDEQIHYATIQHWAGKKIQDANQTKISNNQPRVVDPGNISTYILTEESTNTAIHLQFDTIKSQKENILDFSSTTTGIHEESILVNNWNRDTAYQVNNTSGTRSFYYWLGAGIEHALSDRDIFTRLLSSRLLSLVFGVLIVILSYLTAKNTDRQLSIFPVLFALLIAFQPMIASTATQVNIDIALIFSFSLFLYAGSCVLKKGLTWKNALLSGLAATLGLLSKGPGLVLALALYPLFAWGAYMKYFIPEKKKQFFTWLMISTLLLGGIAFMTVPRSYLINITRASNTSVFDSPLQSIGKYLDKTLRQGELRDTSLSYWGNFGWLDTPISEWILSVIISIEIIGFSGVLLYLLTPVLQKRFPKLFQWTANPHWLPERKYILFFLSMILALQLAVRFYDWRVFDYTGQILIGQPGRYFLPNIIGHLFLVVTGIGLFLRTQERFITALKILALGMILLQIYTVINVILPRYYL
ncbi:MAG: DUF2142 domain-containing protein [Candidatus Moraniibacteriota bacterium]|nr:MAG: DUF2142 domain-containing protein [Candidatus Moranbacteria bacterium]